MQKVMMVLGTRPEAIKMAPVYQELTEREDLELRLVSTGQHGEMLSEVLELFGLQPDHDLALLQPGQSLTRLLGRLLTALEPVLEAEAPDLVLVHGDTLTSFGTALACFYQGIKVAHVEAGLRSNRLDSPFPEEFHRQTVARVADLHFAPTEEARENLLADGVEPARIEVTGSTAVDALEAVRGKGDGELLSELEEGQELVVITLHRRETGVRRMARLLATIRRLADERPEVLFLFPVHPSPTYRQLILRHLGGATNIHLTSPLAYPDFVQVMERASLLLTDSGGIQEEAAHLKRPVLLLRDATERPEAVEAGSVRLVGTDPRRLRAAFEEVFSGRTTLPSSPYLPGSASRRIAEALA